MEDDTRSCSSDATTKGRRPVPPPNKPPRGFSNSTPGTKIRLELHAMRKAQAELAGLQRQLEEQARKRDDISKSEVANRMRKAEMKLQHAQDLLRHMSRRSAQSQGAAVKVSHSISGRADKAQHD